MRPLFLPLFLIALGSRAFAGEIVVYNQKWTRKDIPTPYTTGSGQGYLLLDFANRQFTRISTGKASYGSKIYWVETYTAAVFSEPSSTTGTFLAVQGSARRAETVDTWERSIFLKGKETLLSIGPSQQKQIPKVISGLRRMAQSGFITVRMEEESFSATFNAKITADTNGNSRTLEQEVQLLTTSLEEAGYRAR